LRAAVVGVEAVLIAATLGVCGAPFQKLRDPLKHDLERESIEYAVVLMLMLLLSPMSSKAHFGVLLLPGFLLARAAIASGSRWLWGCVLVSVALASASHKDLLGEQGYTFTLWYGTTTWETLLLLVGCLTVVWRAPRAQGAGRLRAVAACLPSRAA
jgi:hypothetical protein